TVTDDRSPHYEPFGWHHWPEHPWFSYQFRRGLGETQEGGGTVSECLQAAARMIPGDTESWHREWLALAERNFTRGEAAAARGPAVTSPRRGPVAGGRPITTGRRILSPAPPPPADWRPSRRWSSRATVFWLISGRRARCSRSRTRARVSSRISCERPTAA